MRKSADFDDFRDELVAGLKPVGGAEAMLAERIVSLSWRLKRVERMNSEAIDVMIAKIETDSIDISERSRAGLLDRETGRSELVLGWAMLEDFKHSQVLERLLMYEKRIESSLYKAMDELRKLRDTRKREQDEAEPTNAKQAIPILIKDDQDEAATHRGRDAPATPATAASHLEDGKGEKKKQSQCVILTAENAGIAEEKNYHSRNEKDNLIHLGGLRDPSG